MSNNLAVNTPKGLVSVEQEKRAFKIYESNHPDVGHIHTPIKKEGVIDTFFYRGDTLIAVSENKCRELTQAKLKNNYENRWLISASKLQHGEQYSKDLTVPFVGLLYLVPDDVVMTVVLFDEGKWKVDVFYEEKETQKTINGGKKIDLVGLVLMDDAKVLRMKK